MSRRRVMWLAIAGVLCAGVLSLRPWTAWPLVSRASEPAAEHSAQVSERAEPPPVTLSDAATETIALEPDLIRAMGLQFAPVVAAPATRPLRMNGQLALDPGRLVHVQSRFGGEVVSVITDPKTGRTPQVGDHVEKGQILAEIWSKEVGEKKSDLVDAMSNLFLHESVLEKLRKLQDGAVPLRTIEEMRRTYESDLIAVSRLRRTLRSWRISEAELQEIDGEARRLHEAALHPRDPGKAIPDVADAAREQRWAEIDVIAPTSGVILEKNMTVGDTIDSSFDLFKIADLTRMRVMAYVFEEDLPKLLSLPADHQRWRIEWQTNSTDGSIVGEIETVGHVIDPNQHTAVVSGWLTNPDLLLRVGQFVTVTVDIPAEQSALVVPVSAMVDQGERTYVLVADNAEGTRVSRRRVRVLRRTGESVWLMVGPDPHASASAVERPLALGERVLVSGAVELHARLVQLLSRALAAPPPQ